MSQKDKWLAELRQRISEVSPEEVGELIAGGNGITIIDVREGDEYRQGHLPGAIHLPRGFLELQAEGKLAGFRGRIIAYCAAGIRSLFAADTLNRMGFDDVVSMAGGFTRWKQNGHPYDVPVLLTDRERERYQRHLTMDEVGESGQIKLKQAKVLCVGAGGLGSPAAYYLAAAGIGKLGIIDYDVVDRSNSAAADPPHRGPRGRAQDRVGAPDSRGAQSRHHRRDVRGAGDERERRPLCSRGTTSFSTAATTSRPGTS